MAITIYSPHSGRPVKVREQDIGRAVRDEAGRIFYVLPREGGGHYAAVTRKGSEKDLQRYDDLLDRVKRGEIAAEASQTTPAHDATGPGRPGTKRRAIFLLILLLVIAAITWYILALQGVVPGIPGVPGLPGSGSPALPSPGPGDPSPLDVPTPDLPDVPPVDPPDDAPLGAAASAAPALVRPVSSRLPEPPTEPWTPLGPDLRYRIDRPGEGPVATAGSWVEVGLEVSTPGGPPLYRTREGRPRSFVLWAGQVGPALDQGVAGMRVGEQRTLLAAAHLIDGALAGADRYPEVPRTTVQLVVELLAVKPGVDVQTLRPGDGAIAGPGDALELAYVARVAGRDRPFATSDAGPPLRFTLGEGKVITGLELAALGMAVGETRRATLPPYLAYGDRGFGQIIPPASTLDYEITLKAVNPASGTR